MNNHERLIHKKCLKSKKAPSKLINVEPIRVPAFWVSIVSGSISLSVNTTTDCGRSFSGLLAEGPVDTIFLKTKITIN